jgi:hypothetical protein
MMEGTAALRIAIDLLNVPSRARSLKSRALPQGVDLLLRIAARDQEAEQAAAESAGRPPIIIREAATFFIEQILLAPDSDNYRVLGASRDAPIAELRRNMALLLKGMHPDMGDEVRSLFAHRVISAWDALKTAERRAVYDAMLDKSLVDRRPRKNRKSRSRFNPPLLSRSGDRISNKHGLVPAKIYRAKTEGLLFRALRLLLAGIRA